MNILACRRGEHASMAACSLVLTALSVGAFGFSPVTSVQAPIPLDTGRIAAGQPAGLFYRIEANLIGSGRVETRTWLFLPGNRVSRFHPLGGALFDPSRCNPDTCGTYQVGGGQLSVRWDGGSTTQWTFAADAEGIRLDGTLHRPARAMTPAALVGRWSSGRGGIANIYTFDGNGQFSFGTSSSPLTGTYRVQGLTLTLTFSDGDVRRRTLFAASPGEPAGMISVDGEAYARSQQ